MITIPFVAVVALKSTVAFGGFVDTFEDFTPGVTVAGQGDWSAYYGADHALVKDTAGVAYEGTHYLDYWNSTYSTYPMRVHDELMNATTNYKVTYYFRIGDPEGPHPEDAFSRFWWSTGHYPPGTMISTATWYGGALGYYQGINFINTGVTINQGEWYKYEYTYDLADEVQWVVTRTADSSVVLDITFNVEPGAVNSDWSYSLEFNPGSYSPPSGFHTLLDNVSLTPGYIAHLPGDANGNGVVSAHDYDCVQANFGHTGEPWILGDANGDGVVSADDYGSVQSNFGNFLGGVAGSGGAGASAPEPTSLALLGLGGLTLLRRRRK